MVLPACFTRGPELFPLVRHASVHALRQRGWSQARIAELLGISQAMVSRYERSAAPTEPIVHRLLQDVLLRIDGGSGVDWCQLLEEDNPNQRVNLEADFQALEAWLLRDGDASWVPEIGLTLAAAIDQPERPDDVLGYPTRFVTDGRRIVRTSQARWGASQHLSQMLIGTGAGALLILRADTMPAEVRIEEQDPETLAEATRRAIAKGARTVLALGPPGHEPLLYLQAEDPRHLRMALEQPRTVIP